MDTKLLSTCSANEAFDTSTNCLSVLAQKSPTGDLHRLADESMTPGGLNELARKIIHDSGGYDYLKPALHAVTNRVITTSHNEREK